MAARLPPPVAFMQPVCFVAVIGTVAAVDSRHCFHRMALWIGCCNNHPSINCVIHRHRGFYHYNHRSVETINISAISTSGGEKYCMVNSEAGQQQHNIALQFTGDVFQGLVFVIWMK